MNFATPEMKPVTVEAKFPNYGPVTLEGVGTNTNSRKLFLRQLSCIAVF